MVEKMVEEMEVEEEAMKVETEEKMEMEEEQVEAEEIEIEILTEEENIKVESLGEEVEILVTERVADLNNQPLLHNLNPQHQHKSHHQYQNIPHHNYKHFDRMGNREVYIHSLSNTINKPYKYHPEEIIGWIHEKEQAYSEMEDISEYSMPDNLKKITLL